MSTYEQRVRAREAEGLTRSDAQGVVDAEELKAQRQSTHTPGPWNCKSAHYRGLSAGIVRDALNDPVADCRYSEIPIRDKKTPEQIDANARLIAAAPELLEALRKAKAALYNVPEVGKKYDQQHSHTHTQACLDIESAIAKAEGKEPRP